MALVMLSERKKGKYTQKITLDWLNRHGRLFKTIAVGEKNYCEKGKRLNSTLLKQTVRELGSTGVLMGKGYRHWLGGWSRRVASPSLFAHQS